MGDCFVRNTWVEKGHQNYMKRPAWTAADPKSPLQTVVGAQRIDQGGGGADMDVAASSFQAGGDKWYEYMIDKQQYTTNIHSKFWVLDQSLYES